MASRCPRCDLGVTSWTAVCPRCGFSLYEPDPGSPEEARTPGAVGWDASDPGPGRPLWVYLIVLVYLLLAGTVTFGPLAATALGGAPPSGVLAALIYAVVVTVCGVSLLVIPVSRPWALPDRQRPIWFPLAGSATLAAAVFFGLAVAAHEYVYGGGKDPDQELAFHGILIALPFVWLGWVLVFWGVSGSVDRDRLNGRLYKTLVAGSVLELLVAIPMHLVVRQRGYCCAGFGTGLGIGVGLIVMLVALGPAVFILFYRRYRQAYVRRPRDRE